jgi:hypothetical protein
MSNAELILSWTKVEGFNLCSFAKDKEKVGLLLEETSWMDSFNYKKLTNRVRVDCLQCGYTEETFPTCYCGNPVTYNKSGGTGFIDYCSDDCKKRLPKLPIDTQNKLNDRNWLYQKRVIEEMSAKSIGLVLGCSEFPVGVSLKKFDITLNRKLTESPKHVQDFLNDIDFLTSQISKKRKMQDIADDIGSSKASVSLACKKFNLVPNTPNSYARTHITVSKECQQVIDYIQTQTNELIEINNRSILNGKEIDILIPSLNIGFEYNGIFSHIHKHKVDIINKEKSYHYDKTFGAKQHGIKLFHIFSDDWLSNTTVMKSMISAKLGIFERTIYARKCEIVEVPVYEKITFLNANHIQGKDRSKYAYGLKFDGELVALMSFCNSRYNKNYTWELNRFAVIRHTKVIGGFSRLLKAFRRIYSGSIISYADISYSDGGVYYKNDFRLLKQNKPGYSYVNLKTGITRMHRSNFTKAKISTTDDTRTEEQIMFANGYRQIYDCGTYAFVLD